LLSFFLASFINRCEGTQAVVPFRIRVAVLFAFFLDFGDASSVLLYDTHVEKDFCNQFVAQIGSHWLSIWKRGQNVGKRLTNWGLRFFPLLVIIITKLQNNVIRCAQDIFDRISG
jgi:hypothetical protein